MIDLELTAVADDNFAGGLSTLRSVGLELLDDIHALDDGAKDHVFVIQPGRLHCCDEELTAVAVRPGIRHRHHTWSSVLEREVLVLELVAVDGLAAGAIVLGEVAALAHEVGDDAVEGAALVAKALLAGAQSAEVLSCLRNHIRSQFDDDSSNGRIIHSHVKENL